MQTIVVPLDGSAQAESAIRPAVAFAARTENTHVLLMTCVDRNSQPTQEYLEAHADRFPRNGRREHEVMQSP